MKLLCINNKEIIVKTATEIIVHNGEGLIEGEVYETRGKAFKDEDEILCYYIEGLGIRLCQRFTELLDEEKTAEEKAIDKLKEEFQLN